jgi:DNA-binding MarR family transcriptional regulator
VFSGPVATLERDALIETTVIEMRRVFFRAMANAAASRSKDELPMLAHFALHAALARGGATQGQLADRLGVTSGHITGVVDKLEQDGLVRRRRDTKDRRVVHVVATLKGRHMHHREHRADSWQAGGAMFEGWSDEEIRAFREAISRFGHAGSEPGTPA